MTSLQKASLDDMRYIAARICRDYLTGKWKTISAEDIIVNRISGGLSNFLYYVTLPDVSDNNDNLCISNSEQLINSTIKRLRKDSGQPCCEPKEVLLRVYGQTHGEHALETMLTESVVFTLLSERNLGPKLYGIFPGGRIEQYIPARSLITIELCDYKISMKIAEKMAEIHSLDIPVSKEPDWLWSSMDRWVINADKILTNSCDNVEHKSKIEQLLTIQFREEIVWLKTIVKKVNSPVVFCHNDLQEGNVLIKTESVQSGNSSMENLSFSPSNAFEDSAITVDNRSLSIHFSKTTSVSSGSNNNRKRSMPRVEFSDFDKNAQGDYSNSNSSDGSEPDLIIIDYEYCAYNYRGFDLANHFIEWTLDYTNPEFPYYTHHKYQYPSLIQRKNFIITYLKKINEDAIDYTPSEDEISKISEEIRVFLMASHLFWTLWSVVNVHQNIEFGYWEYAMSRLQEYLQIKSEFINK